MIFMTETEIERMKHGCLFFIERKICRSSLLKSRNAKRKSARHVEDDDNGDDDEEEEEANAKAEEEKERENTHTHSYTHEQ
jgi:hypothetical protein